MADWRKVESRNPLLAGTIKSLAQQLDFLHEKISLLPGLASRQTNSNPYSEWEDYGQLPFALAKISDDWGNINIDFILIDSPREHSNITAVCKRFQDILFRLQQIMRQLILLSADQVELMLGVAEELTKRKYEYRYFEQSGWNFEALIQDLHVIRRMTESIALNLMDE